MLTQRPCEVDEWPFNFECRIMPQGQPAGPSVSRPGWSVMGRVERFFGIDPKFIHYVTGFARQWRPDVVIGMNYQSLACLARLSEFPTICDLGDDETLHRLRELLHGRATGKWQDLKALAAIWLFERRQIPRVSAVTVLSEADVRFCRWHTGHPRVECIPHGVDCHHYRPVAGDGPDDRIIFWGSLSFGPNISAILFFAEKVWPLILQKVPQARWTIIGRGDSPLLEPVRKLPGVDFLGYVDDIRPHVARSAVAVVPMVSGAGIKNKIMEAWAMAVPVVCTPRALGDLPGIAGENVWLARSPRHLAEGVLTLIADRSLRRRIGLAARNTAVTHCSWDAAAGALELLCMNLLAPNAKRAGRGPVIPLHAEVLTHASA